MTPTFTMAGKTNKKDKKSGLRPSTASQGKALSRSSSQSQKYTYDSDSSVGFIEDEFDSYDPPKTRGSKGAKSSKKPNWKAQDFAKNPINFPVKIKQEPVSPTKEEQGATGGESSGISSGRPKAGTFSGPWGKIYQEFDDSHFEGGYHPSFPPLSGDATGSQSGSQMAAKPRPVGTPESTQTAPPPPPGLSVPPTPDSATAAVRARELSPPPTRPKQTTETSTPGRTPSKARTPTKESTPRRSPRLNITKEQHSSPGKVALENQLSQFSGLARKKKATQDPIPEESDPTC